MLDVLIFLSPPIYFCVTPTPCCSPLQCHCCVLDFVMLVVTVGVVAECNQYPLARLGITQGGDGAWPRLSHGTTM